MSTPDTPAPQWQPITADNQPVFPCWLHRCTDGNDYWFHAEKKPAWLPERDYDLWAVGEQPPDDQPTAPTAQPETSVPQFKTANPSPEGCDHAEASQSAAQTILSEHPAATGTPRTDAELDPADISTDSFGYTYVSTSVAKRYLRDLSAARAEVERLTRERDEAQQDERWLREMLTDYRIQYDDHPVGRRVALNCFIHDLRTQLAASHPTAAMVEACAAELVALNYHVEALKKGGTYDKELQSHRAILANHFNPEKKP